jgi:hypothetical protein
MSLSARKSVHSSKQKRSDSKPEFNVAGNSALSRHSLRTMQQRAHHQRQPGVAGEGSGSMASTNHNTAAKQRNTGI